MGFFSRNKPIYNKQIKDSKQLHSILKKDNDWKLLGDDFLERLATVLFDNRLNLPNYEEIIGPNADIIKFSKEDGDTENQKIREFLFVADLHRMVERNFRHQSFKDNILEIEMYALTLYRQGSASFQVASDMTRFLPADD